MNAKLARIVGMLSMSLMLASAVTPAAAQANCEMYGRLALQQQRENEQRSCGFTGPSWSTDLRAHISWCSTVSPEQWRAELQKRAAMLAECK
ncbi:MAG: hypothetical protein ACFCUN_13305 [Hyphomicrobiaceae bacterium]